MPLPRKQICRVCGTILEENADARWSKWDKLYCSKECLRTDYLARAIALKVKGEVEFDYEKYMAGEQLIPTTFTPDAESLKEWDKGIWDKFKDDCKDRDGETCKNDGNTSKICDKTNCPKNEKKTGPTCAKCGAVGMQEIIEVIDGQTCHKGHECPKCHFIRRPRI